jgi:hypothetical protein
MSTRLRDSIEAILNAHKSHGNYVYPAPELRAANMVGLLVDLHDAYRHSSLSRLHVAVDLGNPSPDGNIPVAILPTPVIRQTIHVDDHAEVEVNFSPETVRRVSAGIRPDAETPANPIPGDIK